MADYTELVKSLRYVAENHSTTSPEILTDAADAIEELEKKMLNWQATADDHWEAYQHWFHKYMDDMPTWISVTERLPEEKDRYLTVSVEPWFGTTVVDIMRWSGVWMYDGRQTEATVTHWMPLPEPPKEETE